MAPEGEAAKHVAHVFLIFFPFSQSALCRTGRFLGGDALCVGWCILYVRSWLWVRLTWVGWEFFAVFFLFQNYVSIGKVPLCKIFLDKIILHWKICVCWKYFGSVCFSFLRLENNICW